MSFSFSIGDIILVSQLAYGLYESVSSGRKAASRDLKELEEVLFSLKCALDHLREVCNDVLARPGFRYGGSGFKEKLDVMIDSCASTLQELDQVTEKYRNVESQANKGKTKLRTLGDVKKSIQVNWQRVRWDHEKQSLQQYREKLKSHTDAINLMLTSVTWANTAFADANSKKNHEKTQSLLSDVLRNPAADAGFRAMVQEMHAILLKPSPRTEGTHMRRIENTEVSRESLGIAAYSSHSPLFGESSGPIEERLAPVSLYTTSNSPFRNTDARMTVPSPNIPSSGLEIHSELPDSTTRLNNERRAFGAKEFEAFEQRQPQPKEVAKPSLLINVNSTSQDIQACIPYLFQSTAEGKQQTQELRSEISRWTQEFFRFVNDDKAPLEEKDECLLKLLGALNEAVECSSRSMRQLFYETSDSSGFKTALDQVQTTSKSVRVMKEIEEFEDAKEEWEKQERVR